MGDLVGGDAVTFIIDLMVPDPVPHVLRKNQRVRCAYPTPGLNRLDEYIVLDIFHDPQGDMVTVMSETGPKHTGSYWLWRFEPLPRDL